jgi:hypothetical protein
MRNRLPALAPVSAIIGGLLWIVYAILLLVRPAAVSITATVGAVGLAALAIALPAAVQLLRISVQGSGRFGVAMNWMTLLAAAAALAGSLLQHASLAASAITAGEVLLAFGVMLVAIEAAGQPASPTSGSALFVVGMAGMLGLLAQALAAVALWMLPIYAALVMAIYGLAWVRFGSRLAREGQ